MLIVVKFNDPKAVGGGRNGGWLSALCRRERDCGLEWEPRAVPDSATGRCAGAKSSKRQLSAWLDPMITPIEKESLAENDLAVLTPER